jgi:hypothetical protein
MDRKLRFSEGWKGALRSGDADNYKERIFKGLSVAPAYPHVMSKLYT